MGNSDGAVTDAARGVGWPDHTVKSQVWMQSEGKAPVVSTDVSSDTGGAGENQGNLGCRAPEAQ